MSFLGSLGFSRSSTEFAKLVPCDNDMLPVVDVLNHRVWVLTNCSRRFVLVGGSCTPKMLAVTHALQLQDL